MLRYYWFITKNPKTPSASIGYGEQGYAYIKRSIVPPTDNIFYITEVVNDYDHTIKEKNNPLAISKFNDGGRPLEIHNIAERIKSRLVEQWAIDNIAYRKEQNDKIITMDEGISLDALRMGDMTAFARKKSPVIKKIKRRIKPCKCKIKARRK